MANYLIQDTTLTSIADEVRTLSGTEETLSPEAMKEKVAEGNEGIAAEADLITQIQTALGGGGKGGGGNSTINTCTIVHNGSLVYDWEMTACVTVLDNNEIKTIQTAESTIQNVLCNSIITYIASHSEWPYQTIIDNGQVIVAGFPKAPVLIAPSINESIGNINFSA